MSEDAFWRAVGIFVTVLLGFVAAFIKHVIDDAKTRERLATLEADAKTTKEEVKSLRDRWHDIRDQALRGTWEMLQDRFEAFREEIRRTFRRKDE